MKPEYHTKVITLWITLLTITSVFSQSVPDKLLTRLDSCRRLGCEQEVTLQIAYAYQTESNLAKALEYFNLYNISAEKDTAVIQTVLNNRSLCAQGLGEWEQAASNLKMLLLYLKPGANSQRIAAIERLFELTAFGDRNYAAGIPYLKELASYYQKANDKGRLAQVYNNLGYAYRKLKDEPASQNYYQACYDLLTDPRVAMAHADKMKLHLNFGVLFTEKGDMNKALQQFEFALQHAKADKDILAQVSVLNYFAAYYLRLNQKKEAEAKLKESLAMLKTLESNLQVKQVMLRTYELQNELLLNQRRIAEFKASSAQLKALKDEIMRNEQAARKILYENLLLAERRERELIQQQREANLREEKMKRRMLEQEQQNQLAVIQQKELLLARQQRDYLLQQNKLKDVATTYAQLLREQAQNELLREREMQKAQLDSQRIAALKKDNEISQLLIKEQELQVANASKQRNFYLAVIALTTLGLLVVILLLQKIDIKRKILASQQKRIASQNAELVSKNNALQQLNSTLQEKQQILDQFQQKLVSQNDQLLKLNGSLEEKVQERTADLVKINRELMHRADQIEEFTRIISHNIRAPIARIMGIANIMNIQKEAHIETMWELKSKLVNSALEADQVLKDLNIILDVRNTLTEEYEVVVIEEVFDDVLAKLYPAIRKHEVLIHWRGKSEHRIFGLRRYLADVVHQLLSNAIKFKHPERQCIITITVFSEGNRVWFKVADNGTGFNMNAMRGKVFKMYQKFHPQKEGKGLGLYLAKNQLDAMKASIEVSAEEGVGATFQVSMIKA